MQRGFYTVMAAQFFSSLADNALFIAAAAILVQTQSPAWMTPAMKLGFHLSYVLLAAFVGAFADSRPKGDVMFITNLIKISGCSIIFFFDSFSFAGLGAFWPVFLGYMVAGLGAAAYSPAKYGIVTEMLPPEQLVKGNGWIEALTVISIILGTVCGGLLIKPGVAATLLAFDPLPMFDTHVDTPAEAAILVIGLMYAIAAAINRAIPDTGARYPKQETNPIQLLKDFWHCVVTLWTDKLGQISLAVTTLFWGAGATLQLVVIEWGKEHLGLRLDQASVLMGIASIGTIVGAIVAGRFVSLKRALHVMPFGVAMGLVVMLMPLTEMMTLVYLLLAVIGGLGGFFVVPMNALLQHRGYVKLSAGHSIAVQNFNEQLNILLMIGLYSVLLSLGLSINTIICLFGVMVVVMMLVFMRWNKINHQRDPDLDRHIGEAKH